MAKRDLNCGINARKRRSKVLHDEEGNVFGKEVYEYNSDGHVTKCTSYNQFGEKRQEQIFDGTDSNRILKKIELYGFGGGSTSVYEYNSDGYLTKCTTHDNESGRRIQEQIFDGTESQRILKGLENNDYDRVDEDLLSVYEYNSDGYLTKCTTSGSESGDYIRETEYYASGKKKSEIDYDYTNGKNRVVRKKNWDEDGCFLAFEPPKSLDEKGVPFGKYRIGGRGPAGGFIIFDKGEYSDGWRYLEAAPRDLIVVDGKPTVASCSSSSVKDAFPFCFIRESKEGPDLFVNGKTEYNESDCTGQGIGSGKKNTEMLFKMLNGNAWESEVGKKGRLTPLHPTRLCKKLEVVANGETFNDWFLPSIEEMRKCFLILQKKRKTELGALHRKNYPYYWTSSEAPGDPDYMQTLECDKERRCHDYYRNLGRSWNRCWDGRVRPIRAF